jgi:hypothetical protein
MIEKGERWKIAERELVAFGRVHPTPFLQLISESFFSSSTAFLAGLPDLSWSKHTKMGKNDHRLY